MLGPLEAVHDGMQVPLGSRKQRALLAILLLRANEVVAPDALIDELWGERPPPSAAHTLQVYVSRLRSAFRQSGGDDGILVTRPAGYLLRVGFGELDLHRFEHLAEGGAGRSRRTRRSARPSACARPWLCGAAIRWPISHSSPSRASTSSGSRSCGWPRSRIASTPISRSGGIRRSSRKRSGSSLSTRCASGCAVSACSRSTAPAGRPTR